MGEEINVDSVVTALDELKRYFPDTKIVLDSKGLRYEFNLIDTEVHQGTNGELNIKVDRNNSITKEQVLQQFLEIIESNCNDWGLESSTNDFADFTYGVVETTKRILECINGE